MSLQRKSRMLVRALRHDPDSLNLTIDKKGWTSVSDVLKSLSINKDDLDVIVTTNNKSRFEYDNFKTKIRASQGHSLKNIEVFKDWNIFIPIGNLYHGTPSFSVKSILDKGLIPKTRTHVHLSKDIETARNVGSRHGTPIILIIDAVKMYKDNIKLYESKNGVILVDNVPSIYITVL